MLDRADEGRGIGRGHRAAAGVGGQHGPALGGDQAVGERDERLSAVQRRPDIARQPERKRRLLQHRHGVVVVRGVGDEEVVVVRLHDRIRHGDGRAVAGPDRRSQRPVGVEGAALDCHPRVARRDDGRPLPGEVVAAPAGGVERGIGYRDLPGVCEDAGHVVADGDIFHAGDGRVRNRRAVLRRLYGACRGVAVRAEVRGGGVGERPDQTARVVAESGVVLIRDGVLLDEGDRDVALERPAADVVEVGLDAVAGQDRGVAVVVHVDHAAVVEYPRYVSELRRVDVTGVCVRDLDRFDRDALAGPVRPVDPRKAAVRERAGHERETQRRHERRKDDKLLHGTFLPCVNPQCALISMHILYVSRTEKSRLFICAGLCYNMVLKK